MSALQPKRKRCCLGGLHLPACVCSQGSKAGHQLFGCCQPAAASGPACVRACGRLPSLRVMYASSTMHRRHSPSKSPRGRMFVRQLGLCFEAIPYDSGSRAELSCSYRWPTHVLPATADTHKETWAVFRVPFDIITLGNSGCMPHLLGVRWCSLFSSRQSYYGNNSCSSDFKIVYLVTCRGSAPSIALPGNKLSTTAHDGHARYSNRSRHSRYLENYISSVENITSPSNGGSGRVYLRSRPLIAFHVPSSCCILVIFSLHQPKEHLAISGEDNTGLSMHS